MNGPRDSELQALRVSIEHQEAELARARRAKAPNSEIERIRTVLLRLEQSLRELAQRK
jgi:hypothetical protein